MKSTIIALAALFFMAFGCKKDATPKSDQDTVEVVQTQAEATGDKTIGQEEVMVAEQGETKIETTDQPKGRVADKDQLVLQETEANKPKKPAPVDNGQSGSVKFSEVAQPKVKPGSVDTGDVYAPGNTWNYVTRIYQNGELTKTVNTTQIVAKREGNIVTFKEGSQFKIDGDKVYELQPTRMGAKIESLKYFVPKDGYEEYRTMIGGDAVAMATAKSLDTSVELKSGSYPDCIVFRNGAGQVHYYSPTKGLVKMEQGKPGDVYYSIQELVSTNF
ncbi:MAG: hypothetical protein KTR13_08890 [Saprospiraceae bacterium]|nr:hypothetical protein [Saprospiraceae bacterium]